MVYRTASYVFKHIGHLLQASLKFCLFLILHQNSADKFLWHVSQTLIKAEQIKAGGHTVWIIRFNLSFLHVLTLTNSSISSEACITCTSTIHTRCICMTHGCTGHICSLGCVYMEERHVHTDLEVSLLTLNKRCYEITGFPR